MTVNVTYLVGSRHEGYGETGMAHLLEHMVFKGTPKLANISQELGRHGARSNGTTWFDRTNYFETFPATDENLDWALASRPTGWSTPSSQEGPRHRDDGRAQRVRDGREQPAQRAQERAAGRRLPLAQLRQATIGARSDIENVPIERLQAFYRTYYQPDNAVLVVAGKLRPGEDARRSSTLLRPDPAPARALPAPTPLEPAQDGERSVTLRARRRRPARRRARTTRPRARTRTHRGRGVRRS